MVKRILVVGAGGPLGFEIARALLGRGHAVAASYRTDRPGLKAAIAQAGAATVRLDLSNPAALRAALLSVDAAIFTPILTTSRIAADMLRPGQPAPFFSSNNVLVDPDAPVYAALQAAETALREAAPRVTILRPTMIYGHPGDGNLSRLMRFMIRRRVVPRPTGVGLQQPVFYRDLARIAADHLLDPAAAGKTIAVGGPDVVTVGRLYSAVAAAARTGCLPLPLPANNARRLLPLVRRLGFDPPVTEAQLRRVHLDKRAGGPLVVTGDTPLAEGLAVLARALEDER